MKIELDGKKALKVAAVGTLAAWWAYGQLTQTAEDRWRKGRSNQRALSNGIIAGLIAAVVGLIFWSQTAYMWTFIILFAMATFGQKTEPVPQIILDLDAGAESGMVEHRIIAEKSATAPTNRKKRHKHVLQKYQVT